MPQEEKDQGAYSLSGDESRRAVAKAMSLLQLKDRTEKELSDKLYRAGFSENASSEAMEYVKHFGYINDRRYVENYIMFQSGKKSQKEMVYKLAEKGISRELIWQVMEETEYNGEEDAICRLILKKLKGRNLCELSFEERNKISAYLGRKGYEWNGIKNVFLKLDAQSSGEEV